MNYDNNNSSNNYVHKISRKDIKVIRNKQLVPPRTERKSTDYKVNTNVEDDMVHEWKMVANKEKKRLVAQNRIISNLNQYSDTPDSGSSVLHNRLDVKVRGQRFRFTKPKVRKPLNKPTVVTITGKPEGATYAQILNKAKQNVSLGNLGIENVRMRRGMNGALIIELPGLDGKRLASTLRNTLEEVLKEDAKVSNPVAMGEIRLRGIDPATTQDEIGYALEN